MNVNRVHGMNVIKDGEMTDYTMIYTEFLIRLEKDQPAKCVLGLAANDEVLHHCKDKFLVSI